jgi:membrane-associated protease RseP (regulator of RpoE activity)
MALAGGLRRSFASHVHESLDRALPPPEPGDSRPAVVPAPPGRDRLWVHTVLFLLTVVSTTAVGALHYFFFRRGFSGNLSAPVDFGEWSFYLPGLWYSVTVLTILGCHEMGHYVACRHYRVDASLPFFLPAPFLSGTLGAFIRIRQRIPSKIALFDIGLAGPIAGFLVAVPALFMGLAMSVVERVPESFAGYELGEPLLFRFAAWLIWGDLPDNMSINMHPMAFASWFGLLATALNLFPMGQLDGGHVTYAILGRRSSIITIGTVLLAIGLSFVSASWWVWTGLMVVMLVLMGPHHPPTLDDDTPIDRTRLILAGVGLVMLIVCFTPAPIEEFVGL